MMCPSFCGLHRPTSPSSRYVQFRPPPTILTSTATFVDSMADEEEKHHHQQQQSPSSQHRRHIATAVYGERREVKRKLLDLTQTKLNQLDCEHALRNKVLLQSALRNALDVHLKTKRSSTSISSSSNLPSASSTTSTAVVVEKVDGHEEEQNQRLRLSNIDANIDCDLDTIADDPFEPLIKIQHHQPRHSIDKALVSSPRKRSLNVCSVNESSERRRPSSSSSSSSPSLPSTGKRIKLFRTKSLGEEPMETSSSSSSSSVSTTITPPSPQSDDMLTNLTSYFLQLKTQQN